jgi:kynurenine aminotransferase
MQESLAVVLEDLLSPSPPPFLQELKEMYTRKRKFLVETLKEVGLHALAPEGAYYVVVDISGVKMEEGWGKDPSKSITGLYFERKDWNFCRWLTTEHKLTAIPCSAFYAEDNAVTTTVRFAYCKTDEELERARAVILSLKPYFQ